MKKINLIIASAIAMLAASSCKKESTPAPPSPVTNSPRIVKLEKLGTTWATTYSYNAQGRLAEAKNNSFTYKYDYTGSAPVITSYYTATGKIDSRIDALVLNAGRASQFNTTLYNDQEQPFTPQTIYMQFDANGYQVNKSYTGSEYTGEVTSGNITKFIHVSPLYPNSSFTTTYEFYTDKANKFNLNIFEEDWYDSYLSDNGLFGTMNKNLPKRVTHQKAANTTVTDFTYVTDANGLVTEYTLTSVRDGSPYSSSTWKVTWQ